MGRSRQTKYRANESGRAFASSLADEWPRRLTPRELAPFSPRALERHNEFTEAIGSFLATAETTIRLGEESMATVNARS
jgi:hypothetical protein